MSSGCDLLGLDEATWKPQLLHAGDRVWLETNCYIDVWAELLPALGHPAEAALAFTVRQDFEGDHFTFFKFPLEDLERLFGLSVQELAIYDSVEAHTLEQLKRGRVVLVEVDSHFLPDAGDTYRKGHAKTTIAIVAIDPQRKRLGYFHNTGYHALAGADYGGLFQRPPPDNMFPYCEFVKRDRPAPSGEGLAAASRHLLRMHIEYRPRRNPVTAWREALPQHLERLAARDMSYFHLYAFNLPRQLGANFEMMGDYLRWLKADDLAPIGRRIAEAAKAVQFQLARMASRKKFDADALALDPIEADYDLLMTALAKRFGG